MLSSVFGKTIWERRKAMVWWTLGLLVLAIMTISFYPAVRADQETFRKMIDFMPKGLLGFFGASDPEAILAPAGFVSGRLYASIGSLIAIIFAVGMGTAAIAGEEDKGTMDLLLCNPISRRRLVLEKFASMVVLSAWLAFALLVCVAVCNPIVGLELSAAGLLAANLGMALLALLYGTAALACGAITGKRSLTLGVTTAILITTYFIHGLAPLSQATLWMRVLSPFYWFLGNQPLANGFAPSFALLLLGIPALLGLAVWGFQRRDVAV